MTGTATRRIGKLAVGSAWITIGAAISMIATFLMVGTVHSGLLPPIGGFYIGLGAFVLSYTKLTVNGDHASRVLGMSLMLLSVLVGINQIFGESYMYLAGVVLAGFGFMYWGFRMTQTNQ